MRLVHYIVSFQTTECRCVFCNEDTGACDCPKNTVGPNCELCLQGTYGHDPILGCQNCECERNGVIDGNVACDAKTGQCSCKPSHTGRQCNKCSIGYYNYPLCQKCDQCDSRGVDKRLCDADSGQCFCKVRSCSIQIGRASCRERV